MTSLKRKNINEEKSHNNDAFLIAGGNAQERTLPLNLIQKRRNNRCLQLNRKGFKPSIRKQRYPVQPKDIIWIRGNKYVAKGTFCTGKYVLIGSMKNKEYFNINLIEKYFNVGGLIFI